jgi:hypothetical protein
MEVDGVRRSNASRISTGNKAKGRPLVNKARRTAEEKNSDSSEFSANLRAARSIWGSLPPIVLKNLRELTERHHLSVFGGDVTLLGSKLYVTHAGLLRIGERNECSGIVTHVQKDLSDGTQYLIDWKTTTSRYSEEPAGLLSLDPQMICYSWISGIPDVAVVVFVRKSIPEIQYLKASITDEQRREYGSLVEATIRQIQSGQFPPHSGIRFPQNGCLSCSHLGLCLDRPELVTANLIRKPGASDLDWLCELVD